MPMRLEVKRKLLSRSDRVKSVDLHPTEPWICAALYNGNVHVWNVDGQQLIKTLEVCTNPVRAVKFVARKNWIVTGSDDMNLRVFNYNTLERVHQFEAHSDYIRSIVVHPTLPYILTSSDDMLIRLWDWEKNWKCIQVFEGHNHYVMQLAINPKDSNTFASASLDQTVKVWNLGSTTPNFTLEGHERGVNCVSYYSSGDKPYLVSGSDDKTVKIWDYQTKACVQTLEGHAQNISAVLFHPELPVILTGSEDGTVRVWHSNTYRLESTLNYGLERVWTMTCQKGKQIIGIGYDEGTIVISLGKDEPAMSMDSSGKIVCARHSELIQANLRALNFSLDGNDVFQDGERIPIAFKDMGASEIYPQSIEHNANGRFVVVYGDGEYIVYTAMALRNKTFGQGLEFVWSQSDASMYAVRESNTTVKVYKQMKEIRTFKLNYGAEQIFGGFLLGVRSLTGLTFYDWNNGNIIRRIETSPRAIYWNEVGQLVALCTVDAFFILRYSSHLIPESVTENQDDTEGYENAFSLIQNGEVNVQVRNGRWFGDAFIFTTMNNRLCYFVGGEIFTLALLDRPMYLLGYLPKENRVFLGDRDLQIVCYTLLIFVLEYETAVMRGDFDAANALLPSIPVDQHTKIAQFLEKQGYHKQAMLVTTDVDHKFDLALQMANFDLCYEIIKDSDPDVNEAKLKQLAESACHASRFDLAEKCFIQLKDYANLMLLATSSGDGKLLQHISEEAGRQYKDNIAFLAKFLLLDLEGCFDLLVKAKRFPEAAFFARSYLPSMVPKAVQLWSTWLTESGTKANLKIAKSLANPTDYPNLFPNFDKALATEEWMKSERKHKLNLPASVYRTQKQVSERNPMSEMSQPDSNLNQFGSVANPVSLLATSISSVDQDTNIFIPIEKQQSTEEHDYGSDDVGEDNSDELDDQLEKDLDSVNLNGSGKRQHQQVSPTPITQTKKTDLISDEEWEDEDEDDDIDE